jgi:hypothetical protein
MLRMLWLQDVCVSAAPHYAAAVSFISGQKRNEQFPLGWNKAFY